METISWCIEGNQVLFMNSHGVVHHKVELDEVVKAWMDFNTGRI